MKVTVNGWRFVRESHEYIDVTPPGCREPVECIDASDIPHGASIREAAREWLKDNEQHLADYQMMGA